MNFKKAAMMSKSIKLGNVRMEAEGGEEGGDAGDLVSARSIRFTAIALTKNQFNDVNGIEDLDRVYFNYSANNPTTLRSERHSKILLDVTYKNCSGSITFGVSNKSLEFEGARVKNVSIKLKGEKAFGTLAFTLQAVLPRKLDTLDLEEFFGKVVTLALRFGEVEEVNAAEQQKLELEGGKAANEDDGDSDDDDGAGEESGRGRGKSDGDESRPH